MPISRRMFLGQAGALAVALQGGLLQAMEAASPITVQTPSGALRGEHVGQIHVFRGVPFAEPPVAGRRFRAPELVKPWKGMREASQFAVAATQPVVHMANGEDCLYLNVWAPAAKGSYPVYLWIHGGGFTGGRSSEPIFDGSLFAQEGVVVVTVAYRLGVLGFLEMEPLLGAAYAGSANNGLRDLICALSWVKENIEAFGGDPHRVTIGGQSAGGKLTGLLMAAPSAQPLFHQMISESGGGDRYNKKDEAERIAEGFAALWKSLGHETAELLTASPAQLMEAQGKFMRDWPKHFPLRAEIDGKLLPHIPVETIASGSTRGKRLLIGTCRDESASFIGQHPQNDPVAGDLGNMRLEPFLEVYRKYREVYPELNDEQRRIRALSAEEYWIPSMRVADAHLEGGGTAWAYRVDFGETTGNFPHLAPHGQELRLVWNHPDPKVGNAADEARLAAAMHQAWCAFLKGEAPSAKGLPVWHEFTAKTRATLLVDNACRVEEHPAAREFALWDKAM